MHSISQFPDIFRLLQQPQSPQSAGAHTINQILPNRVERNDGPKESEEDSRQHQLAPGACDEVWQRFAKYTRSSVKSAS